VPVRRSLIERVRTRWHASTEEHRAIFRAVLSVTALSIISKLATAAKEVAVAWRFGVSAVVDAYLLVFNLVNWTILIWFSVLTVVLIPLEARLRRESPEQLNTFRRELLGVTLVVGLLLVAVAEFVMPVLLRSHAMGLPARTTGLALQIVPTLAWLALLGPLVALYSTWMMSVGRNANTLLEGVPSVAIFLAVLLTTGGIDTLVWGTLGGVAVQLVCVAWPNIRSRDAPAPAFGLSSSAWGPFGHGVALVLLGQAILSLTTLIDQFFAAGLGEGGISSLGYATRLVGLLIGIVALPVTRATLLVFSRASGDARTIRRVAFQWAALLGLAGAVAALIGLMVAPWIVKVLLERGTFTANDTDRVATLFRFGLLQLPFYFSSLVFVSLHASRGGYRVILFGGVLGLSVKVAATWLLIGTFGLPSLMMSTALMYLANLLLVIFLA
jgi:putative peptidoglycan lipid II flippase